MPLNYALLLFLGFFWVCFVGVCWHLFFLLCWCSFAPPCHALLMFVDTSFQVPLWSLVFIDFSLLCFVVCRYCFLWCVLLVFFGFLNWYFPLAFFLQVCRFGILKLFLQLHSRRYFLINFFFYSLFLWNVIFFILLFFFFSFSFLFYFKCVFLDF